MRHAVKIIELVVDNMVSQLLKKVTTARCLWVSILADEPKQRRVTRALSVHQYTCKPVSIVQASVNTVCLVAVAFQLGHVLQVTKNDKKL